MNRTNRKPWTFWRTVFGLVTGLLVVAVAFVGWQIWLFKGGVFRTSSFNEAEWKSLARKTTDASCYRGGMAHDLKTNILRTGLTKAEVEKLLGEPDSSRVTFHEYFLGMCSGLRIDFDTLDVHFNSEGRLVKVQVVQH
jgi:hypothetical protein